MKPEDISVGAWTVVEGCDEVFEGRASIIRKFLEENLGLLFREGPHGGEMQLCFRISSCAEITLDYGGLSVQ